MGILKHLSPIDSVWADGYLSNDSEQKTLQQMAIHWLEKKVKREWNSDDALEMSWLTITGLVWECRIPG